MPFGYSWTIFPHPPVQYIPLVPLARTASKKVVLNEGFRLAVFNKPEQIEPSLKKYFLDLPPKWSKWGDKEFCLVALNGELVNLYYRGNQIRGVAKEVKNQITFWLVTTTYFYRNNLMFLLFNEDSKEIGTAKMNLL